MGVNTNIIIQTVDGRRLDYTSPEDLDISLNRIADDQSQPDTRFGEFSYSFSLPKTKNNARVFGFANTPNVKRKFKINPINIRLFNNNSILLEGLLELTGISEDSFECNFYSKLTQLIDSLEDVNLTDVTMPQIENWDYETTMRTHINANYANSDEADYQFPMIFYNTYFTPYSVYNGLTDFEGYNFREEGDRPQQNYYYILNRGATDNEFYFHQFPLCFYVKTMLEKTLEHVGWNLSGSFWETPEAKMMIMLYTGDDDIYDQGVYTSSGTTYLDTSVFMPDIDALDFISNLVNTFNLYLRVDISNKILVMDNYDVIFSSKVLPYDITNKIKQETIDVYSYDNYDMSIQFEEPDNMNIMGDNYCISGSSTNALSGVEYVKVNSSLFNQVYNHIGITGGEIDAGFAAPCVKRMYIRNTDNYSGSITNAVDSVIFLPNVSEQTKYDNNNKKFNKKTTDTTANNDESTIKFKGKPTIMFYYGISNNTFEQQSGKGDSSDYYYVDFDNTKQKIGIASPFAWKAYRDNIDEILNNGDVDSPEFAYASYLQSIYLNMGSNYAGDVPSYSLIFGDSYDLCDTIFTKLYANRFNRYDESDILEAEIIINNVDWINLQLNRSVKYDGEIYSIMELNDYNVVEGEATIKLIKHL